MGGARFGDPSPPHQLRDAGKRLDASDALMFPADGALRTPRKKRRWWPLGKLTEYLLWEVAGERDQLRQRLPLGSRAPS
jgi:hypothetical protein